MDWYTFSIIYGVFGTDVVASLSVVRYCLFVIIFGWLSRRCNYSIIRDSSFRHFICYPIQSDGVDPRVNLNFSALLF